MSKFIRSDASYAKLTATQKLQILEDHTNRCPFAERSKRLKELYGLEISEKAYDRMIRRLREIKTELLAEAKAESLANMDNGGKEGPPVIDLTEIRAKLGSMSKRLDVISREQSFMATQLQAIGAGRKDAFVMYMNMRNLNRVIRNSAFVADALELTGDIPYPGRRDAPIAQIFNYLDRLDKSTEERVDKFLREGFSGAFDRKDMSDVELFMLRLRLIWGCALVNQLERDLQIPLSGGEEEAEALFQREVAPACLFVDFWKDVRQVWLNDVAVQIYHFGKFQTPYESTAAMSKRIMYYQQKQEQKPS